MKNRYYGELSFLVPQRNIQKETIKIKTRKIRGKQYFFKKVIDAFEELCNVFSNKEILKLLNHCEGYIEYEGDFKDLIESSLATAISVNTNQEVKIVSKIE